jgi:hypothetical protein
LGAEIVTTKSLCGVIVKTKNRYGSPQKREDGTGFLQE